MSDELVTLPIEQPKELVAFGKNAATQLINVVKQSHLSIKIQNNDYLKFEAWQTVGRFFGYTVKTDKVEPIELGEVKGFQATAVVLDSRGQTIGGAIAICMNDEKNWKDKPLYSLMSMAQTRASSKALRQVLAWVVVLAGFKPTPAEEMDVIAGEIEPEEADSHFAFRCDECHRPVTEAVNKYSQGKFKRPLCMECQKKIKEDPKAEEQVSEDLPF